MIVDSPFFFPRFSLFLIISHGLQKVKTLYLWICAIQEDDRTGGYANCADEILTYCREKGLNVKVIFLNDGPGLLLGSMWSDYSNLEKRWDNKIRVITLRMVPERLTQAWLEDKE